MVKFMASSGLTSSCFLQPLLSLGFSLLLCFSPNDLPFLHCPQAMYVSSGRHCANAKSQGCGQYHLGGSYFGLHQCKIPYVSLFFLSG